MRSGSLALLILLTSAITTPLYAQGNAQSAPPPHRPVPASQPTSSPETARYQEAPGQSFLEKRFGLSRAEAKRRLRLEDQISEAAVALQAQFSNAFLASIIDQTPVYQVTFVFSRDVPADEVRRTIPAELQSVFKVKRGRYTEAEIRTRQVNIVEALVAAKIAGSVGYDYRTDKFEVTASEEGGQKLLTSLAPELRSDVRFVPGGSPAKIQSGALPRGCDLWRLDVAPAN